MCYRKFKMVAHYNLQQNIDVKRILTNIKNDLLINE